MSGAPRQRFPVGRARGVAARHPSPPHPEPPPRCPPASVRAGKAALSTPPDRASAVRGGEGQRGEKEKGREVKTPPDLGCEEGAAGWVSGSGSSGLHGSCPAHPLLPTPKKIPC